MRVLDNYVFKVGKKDHSITFDYLKGKYTLYVDGSQLETFKPGNYFSFIFGDVNDYFFTIEGVEIVIAMRFGKPRVAVDGTYVTPGKFNGKEFKAVEDLPYWGYIFIPLTAFPPFFLNSFITDYFVGACTAYMCTHFVLKNPDIKGGMPKKIMWCIIIVLATWSYYALFYFLEHR